MKFVQKLEKILEIGFAKYKGNIEASCCSYMIELLPSTPNFQTKDIIIPSAVVLHKAGAERERDCVFCLYFWYFDIYIL